MSEKGCESKPLLPAPANARTIDDHSIAQARARTSRARIVLAGLAIYCFLLLLDPLDLFWSDDDVTTWSAREVERAFLAVPSNASIRETSYELTRSTHIAGSERDLETAQIMARKWSSYLGASTALRSEQPVDAGSFKSRARLYGKQPAPRVWIDTYYVLLNWPLGNSSLELLEADGSTSFRAALREDTLAEDPTSGPSNAEVPPFLGYAARGAARGQLVYANTGSLADFAELERQNISVTGKVVIVKYGGTFRGLKVKAAQEAGAAGAFSILRQYHLTPSSAVLIYSDPGDDGEITAEKGYEPYPAGPARNPSSVQRGSIQYLSQYPGDPLTPGWPSHKESKRLPRDEPDLNVPSIPALPLSFADAAPLLTALNGHGARVDGWEGGLGSHGVEYWTGGDETGPEVKLFNDVEEGTKPLWNTMALIPGQDTNEVIVVGNHRDAWTLGASDPVSGAAALNEIVKGFGALLKRGWRPKRSIVFASWSGEEVRICFAMRTNIMQYGLIGSTEWVEDHQTWLQKHAVAYFNSDGAASGPNLRVQASPSLADLLREVIADLKLTPDVLNIGPLGSDADFTSFLQHAGIASSNVAYSTSRKDPVYHYHSTYDSFAWMERFGDPTFERHLGVAQINGLAALRTIEAHTLPLNISHYASDIVSYVSSVRKVASSASSSLLTESLDGLDRAATDLRAAAEHFEASRHSGRICAAGTRRSNALAIAFERAFISEAGLPGRPWYRHLVVAPGRWLGYGATTLPGVTEALTIDRDADEAARQADRVTSILRTLTASLSSKKHP